MHPVSELGALHPAVAVPVRNEEQRLPSLLAALNQQTWCRLNRRLDVVLVLNNCTDASLLMAQTASGMSEKLNLHVTEVTLPEGEAHVGIARRMAMEKALKLCAVSGDGVILTTDADAIPDGKWIEANLRAIAAGADMVGGRLIGNREEEAQLGRGFRNRASAILRYAGLCDRLASLLDPIDHDPWPRHADHTGGSLAIRADIYHAVGGLPPLPRREDLALVSKVCAYGGRLVHPLDVRVEVSARLVGRAPGGMADCLKEWIRAEAEGSPLLVEEPRRVEARFIRRRMLRMLDGLSMTELNAAAARLRLSADALLDERGRPLPATALVELYAPDEPDAPATMPVALATAQVMDMIADREEPSRAA